jgi:putative DNA primase/helicase
MEIEKASPEQLLMVAEESQKDEKLQNEVLKLIAIRQEDRATELVADLIKETNYIDSIKQDKGSEIWFYENGVRMPNGEAHIKEICRRIFGEAYTPQRANKVIAKIEADSFIPAEDFFRKEQNNVGEIACENGILNTITKELNPFSPEKYFFNKINASYNPNAECPAIKKFLSEVLRNPEDVKVFFEIAGFTLYKRYFLQTAIMFVGEGENGKGITQSLLRTFLGVQNCSSVPLNQLTPESFSCSELFGKLVNLAGDISNTDLKDSGRFKELTSGTDLVATKRKFLRDLFFVNYAKLIFSCNELPRVYDFSHGFWRRWLILEFPYKFLKKMEFDICQDKTNIKLADPDIIKKITTPEEMSGFLNEALLGLERLLNNKQFSYTKSTAEVKDFWIRKSDSFTAFCFDCLEEDSDGYISKKELRKSFNNYCKKYKVKGASDKNIKVVLEDLFGVVESRRTILNDFDRVWEGVKFKQTIHDIHSFTPYSQIGNLHIGSNTMDMLDTSNNQTTFRGDLR